MYFENYSVDSYLRDIDIKGFDILWLEILNYLEHNTSSFFTLDSLSELYEMGLAYVNKQTKKESGVYYTPIDVSNVLSQYLLDLDGENICDVCCGTGNLIISYLRNLSREDALSLIKGHKIYLYDVDDLALRICKTRIGLLLGFSVLDDIQSYCCDFLDSSVHLPKNSKVISNPPYFKITDIPVNWVYSEIIKNSKEFYSAFMEKILKESSSSVMIIPFSFIGGSKFYSLRKLLNDYNGFILSFDNVPGNIFKGKKHGIFNSNQTNSVRASITVVENRNGYKGFRVSPLLRFSSDERSKLLNKEVLNSFVPSKYQIVDEEKTKYVKCFEDIYPLYEEWVSRSDCVLQDILVKSSKYMLTVPNTCRYFVVASKYELDRSGKHCLYFKDKESMEYAYCLLNSSFSYLYWRIFDGAITYTDGLLKSLPIFYSRLTDIQRDRVHNKYEEMVSLEEKYLVYKKNANVIQENIKFPTIFRVELNKLMIEILGICFNVTNLEKIHNNTIF